MFEAVYYLLVLKICLRSCVGLVIVSEFNKEENVSVSVLASVITLLTPIVHNEVAAEPSSLL